MSLDRKKILDRAFDLLNESGPESLTLRRLAQGLGVRAPAIYWHFKNKQDLLDEMGTQVMREAIAEASPTAFDASWEQWAVEYGLCLRRTLLRYREGARMFSGTYLTDPGVFDAMEASLRKLTGAGFSLQTAVSGVGTLYSYTIGFTIEEQAVFRSPGIVNPKYELAKRDERIDKETHPLAHAAGRETFTGYDSRFRAGLEMIVSGMMKTLTAQTGDRSTVQS